MLIKMTVRGGLQGSFAWIIAWMTRSVNCVCRSGLEDLFGVGNVCESVCFAFCGCSTYDGLRSSTDTCGRCLLHRPPLHHHHLRLRLPLSGQTRKTGRESCWSGWRCCSCSSTQTKAASSEPQPR